jgi:hypothetical protein
LQRINGPNNSWLANTKPLRQSPNSMWARLQIDRQHQGSLTGGQVRPIGLHRAGRDVQPQAKGLLIKSSKLIQL